MVKNKEKREENRRLNNKWSKFAKHHNYKFIKRDLKPLYFKKIIPSFWLFLNKVDSLASLLYLNKVTNFSYFKTKPQYYNCRCEWCTNAIKRKQLSTKVYLNQNLEDII